MSPEIEVVVRESEPSTVAYVSAKGPYTKLAPTIGQLYAWIQASGYVPSGPPSAVYFSAPGQVPDSELLWEIRSPVANSADQAAAAEQGRGVKQLSPTLMASTMYRGPFEKIGETYQALAAWITANGYTVAGAPEEVYLSDPAQTKPEDLVTEVRFPVRRL